MPDLLRKLARIDRTKVFLGTLALALVGLFAPGVWGALVLYAVVGVLAFLLSQTWLATQPAMRIVRLVVLAGLGAIATSKLLQS
jgi:hypothetical protein